MQKQERDETKANHEQDQMSLTTDSEKTTVGAGEEILPWARAVLTTTVERWTRLTQTVPAELLNRAPAPGEWSAVECLRHLVETERYGLPVCVQALLAGQEFPAFDPEAPDREEPTVCCFRPSSPDLLECSRFGCSLGVLTPIILLSSPAGGGDAS
jgi:hypothetical protein